MTSTDPTPNTTPTPTPNTDRERALAHIVADPRRTFAIFALCRVALRQDEKTGEVRGYIPAYLNEPNTEPVVDDPHSGHSLQALRDFNLVAGPRPGGRMMVPAKRPVKAGDSLDVLDVYAFGTHTDVDGAIRQVLDGTLDRQVKATEDNERRRTARRPEPVAVPRQKKATSTEKKLDALLSAVAGGGLAGGGRKAETQDEVNARRLKDHNAGKYVKKVEADRLYGDVPLVPLLTGADAVTPDEDEDETYLIPGMWSYNRPQLLVFGDPKVGKSTFAHNAIAALLSGDRLFGSRRVERPVRNVMLIDTEMSASYLKHEFAEQWPEFVDNSDRFILCALGEKGAARQFNVSDPDIQAEWVERLKAAEVDVLVVDCLGPLLRKAGVDENTDAGAFMEAIRETCEKAGVRAHMILDHSSAKGSPNGTITPRGDSKKLDTADTFMHLGRHPQVDDSLRLTVTGRDGNAVLDLERDGYRFAEVVYSDPKAYKRELDAYRLYEAVSNVLTKAGAPLSQTRLVNAVTAELDGVGRPAVTDALKVLVAKGNLHVDGGAKPGGAKMYNLTESEPVEPALPPKRVRNGSQGGESPTDGEGTIFASIEGDEAPETGEN